MSAPLAPLRPPPRRAPDPDARFAELLARAERLRVGGLAFDELRELGRLYRRAAARLARLRDGGDDPEAVRHLNALCVRGYGFLYASGGQRTGARELLLARLPAALARTWHAQALAWTLLLAGALLGGALAARDDEALFALVPAALGYEDGGLEALVQSPEARARFLAREETPAAQNALFGSQLFAHNTQVGLLSFATGIFAALPTCLLQLYNGLVIGAFGAVFLRDPWPLPFLAWILPHAVPELTAITLCASGGLLLGLAVAAPGRAGRAAALRAARDPALLLFGAALPLFALAALVESFVRESALGTAPRLALAGFFLALLGAALASVRRLGRRHAADLAWLGGLTARARGGSRDSGSVPAP
jgi:uncharacterized membrane protein SpoIIM required for sporulation